MISNEVGWMRLRDGSKALTLYEALANKCKICPSSLSWSVGHPSMLNDPKNTSGVPGVVLGTVSMGFGRGTPHDFQMDAGGDKSFDSPKSSGIFKDNGTLEMRRSGCSDFWLIHDPDRCREQGSRDEFSFCICVVVKGPYPVARSRHSAKYEFWSKDDIIFQKKLCEKLYKVWGGTHK
ncbi:hypothetical protein [Circoviridae sp.]|nr:hypothetical protein [Circoviridae sp.]